VKVRYFEEFGTALQGAADAAGEAPLDRARARGHAYVRYGLEHRGKYFAMFSSEGLPARLFSGDTYLGIEVFEAVREEIATVVGPKEDAHLLGVHFWTALHGMVTLRTVRRKFPWPDLDHEIDDLIDRLLAG
jgi:Tetracyclin repressor-like, C-terminal domain